MDKFKVPSTLHIDAAKALITSIESKIEEGGETALFEIIREMREWASETPSFDAEQFGVYPKREDIESAWAFVARELDALYAHVSRLVEELDTTGRSNQEHIGRVKARIANIMNLHTDAKAIVDAESRIRTSSEFFLSDGNIDYTRISGKPLQVRGGSVALPYASEPKALSGKARVTILPGTYTDGIGILGTESNGFPGNNHEVRVTSAQGISVDGGRNGMRFIGETDRHADLSAVLDAEAATWFEYERVSMRKTEEELIAKGRGLDYEIGSGKHIRWLEDESDEPLVLSVLIQMDEPTWLNEIDVRPYIPTNYGASAPVVTDVRVSAEYEPSRSILKRTPLDTEWVFRFDPVYATTVIVSLKQEKGYPTDIGHLVYEEVKESEGRRLTLDTTELTLLPEKPIEVEGPVLRVADMGFTVDETATGTIVTYASQAIGSIHSKPLSESLRAIEEKLNPKTTRMTVRKIEAMRKMIGLRDIVLKEAVYLDKGELVTKPIGFDEPLKRITLEADASPEGNESGVEVMYHVSIDDGATWHPIRPMNSEVGADAPKMYRIVMEDDVSESEVPIIRSNRDVYSLRFKMTMEQVGVRGQSGQVAVPRTPELYAYKMVVETGEKIRATKTPNLLPPRRLKGKVIGGSPQLEDVGNGGPTFEEMTRPALSLEVSKENCHTVPMDVIVKVTHDKPITILTIHLDGKEVYAESPATKEREVRVSVPVSYFANRSRVSVTVMVSDGIVEQRALQAVSIIPCIDVGGRDIDVSASHPQVGETWTISGFAKSEVDIKDVRLYINGRRIDESTLGHVWTERKRVEFIKVFTSEEVDGFGFVLGEPIEILWVATDIEDQIWDDNVVLQYVDVRPPVIPCGQVTYIGVSYYDWNKGAFQTKGVSVPNWDTEDRWFEDGRGIKTLIEWNETLGAPVLMVRNGIGETGGVIVGKIEVRYKKKLDDGSFTTSETIAHMEGSLASSMTEGLDLAYGDKDLTAMGEEIHRTGRFTGNPRLMGLNAYLIPDMGEEYRSNVCGTNTGATNFEPEDNILSAASVEETGAACESNEMFLVEYYDKTLGRNVLHGQKRDGESPQATIFLMDTNEHEVIMKWSDTETGVAIIIESSGAEGLIVTALGVLVRSTRIEARYGVGYFKSNQYEPESDTFAVRTPSEPLEVKDLLMDGDDVPELKGEGALLFLKTKAREKVACAIDTDDPGIKPDEAPPVIEAQSTLFPSGDGEFCLQDIPAAGMPVTFTMSDDIALQGYEIYHNEQKMFEGTDVLQKAVVESANVLINKSDYMVGGQGLIGKADIVFSVDTSGSMDPYITKVTQKMGEFKQYLIDNSVDAYIGVMDSHNPNQYVVPLTPAATVSFAGLSTNGGGWESNQWAQVTGTDALFASSRTGAKKVIVLVTDTYVGGVGQAIPQAVLDHVSNNDIQVSTLGLDAQKTQYEALASVSGGSFLDISGDPDMSRLAQGIGQATATGETFTVIATDTSGKTTSKTFKYRFKDCWDGQTEEMIVSKAFSASGPAGMAVFDRSQYLTFDQIQAGDTIDVSYRVRSGHRITETGFNHWGTGITQVTGEYGPSIDVVYYNPSVEDTGVVQGKIPMPSYAGGPSYTVNQTTLVEEDVTECVLVIDTRDEFMGYFNANKEKFTQAIQKDFSAGVESMVKKMAYDPGQVPKRLSDIHWYYKSTNKKRLHIMTVGANGVESRTYEDPRTFSLDWVQARADAVWGGTTNRVFIDTLTKLKEVKSANSNAFVFYVGLTPPATTVGTTSEQLLRPVLNIVEEEGVLIWCASTNKETSNPASRLEWPTLNDPVYESKLKPYTYLFSTITAPSTLNDTFSSFGLSRKVETKKMRTGVLRRYILRYKTANAQSFWQGGDDEIWIVVLDPAHTDKYEQTNGYTDERG